MNVFNRSLNQVSHLNKMTRIIQVYKSCLDVNENLKLTNKNDKEGNINQETYRERVTNHFDNQTNQFDQKSSILNLEAIKLANKLLSQGKVIAIPTDTIYGVACLVENDESLKRLNEIKPRNLNKALAICVNSLKDIYKWAKVTVDRRVLNELLPGPITVAFERSEQLNKNLNPSFNLICIRIPNDAFVHSLTSLHNPLALTSANVSDDPSPGSINDFHKLWPKLDAIFDADPLDSSDPFRLGSTIVDLSIPNKFRIIRKGCAIDQVIAILRDKHNFDEFS